MHLKGAYLPPYTASGGGVYLLVQIQYIVYLPDEICLIGPMCR